MSRGAARIAELLKPGVDFLGKWMGLFLAPPLASLDASIARLPPYGGSVWANTMALMGVGWGATHAAAGAVASSLVPQEKRPETKAAAAPAAVANGNHMVPLEEAVRRSWVLLGAAGFLGVPGGLEPRAYEAWQGLCSRPATGAAPALWVRRGA